MDDVSPPRASDNDRRVIAAAIAPLHVPARGFAPTSIQPGDLVIDRVTGQHVRVLHASIVHTVTNRPAE